MAKRKTGTGKAEPEAKPLPLVAHEPVLVERRATAAERKRDQFEKLTGMRDELFRSSMQVIGDSLKFRELDPSIQRDLDPAFEKMVAELGEEEAQKTYRIALASWGSAADAPVGLKVASNIAIGIMKANASEKGGAKVLNVGKILISSDAIPQFEEREVE